MASLKRRFNYCYNYSKKNYKDGRVYKGKMKRGKPHGFGKMKEMRDDAVIVYKGEYYRGRKYDKGTWTKKYTDGRLYQYVGAWKDGARNGQGTFTWADGRKYVGAWKDGQRNGQGTFTWANGKFAGDSYVGEWKNNIINGQGTYTWSNGDKYVGEWKYAEILDKEQKLGLMVQAGPVNGRMVKWC